MQFGIKEFTAIEEVFFLNKHGSKGKLNVQTKLQTNFFKALGLGREIPNSLSLSCNWSDMVLSWPIYWENVVKHFYVAMPILMWSSNRRSLQIRILVFIYTRLVSIGFLDLKQNICILVMRDDNVILTNTSMIG